MASQGGLLALVVMIGRRWPIFLMAALPLAMAASIYIYLLPSQYDAETTVAFTPRQVGEVGADVLKVVLPRYVAFLSAPATSQRVAAEAGVPSVLLEQADVAISLDTANLTISVRDTDPYRAALAANALAGAVVQLANEDDELFTPNQVAVALPPTKSAAPARGLLAAAGLIGGLIAGFVATVVAERVRPRIRNVGDVEAASSLPVLGRIPTSRQLVKGRTTATTDEQVGSRARALLAQAERRANSSHPRIVGFTAPTYGHGTTTLATAYAAAAAQRGRRVVLMDGDASRFRLVAPGHGQGLTGTNSPGTTPKGAPTFTALLEGEARLEDCLSQVPVGGVTVLCATVLPEAADLLAQKLAPILEEILTHADQVVVACPPLSDENGELLVAQLPTAILVVRSGSAAAELIDRASQLKDTGVHVLGVVLNRSGQGRAEPSAGWWQAPQE